MTHKTNVALYLRVSTADQTTANQLPELQDYADRRSWSVVENYIDQETGSKESRPALDRLRQDAAAGKFTAVLCWKFDRISRNTRHLLTLHEDFSKLGVALISTTEGIDTTTAAGKMVMTVLGSVAELERANLIERTRAGIRRARAQGKQIGAKPRPVDSSSIKALLASGKSANQIARQLNLSRATVYRRLAKSKAAPVFVADDSCLPDIFSGANLKNCDFEGANLEGADLSRADLTNANLLFAKLGEKRERARGLDTVRGLTDYDLAVLETRMDEMSECGRIRNFHERRSYALHLKAALSETRRIPQD